MLKMTLYTKVNYLRWVIFVILAGLLIQSTNAKTNSSDSIATGKAEKNSLYKHASPYLDMHGRDPVRWKEWNAETLKQAKEQNKLIFVSSGYFSCHWCHVMQRESYQDEQVAKLLNSYFVPVKVDRELNPALDALLIDFTERTQGHAGWPLNVFVTPDGYPLIGMTYVPPDNFLKVLKLLKQQWVSDQAGLNNMAQAVSGELSTAEVTNSTKVSRQWITELNKIFIYQTLSSADEMQGGFGEQNKFPNVPKLNTLIEMYVQSGKEFDSKEQIKDFLIVSFNKMASQGLRDQLGGGFYRYTVDPGWQIPHFEKMLYDNALLAKLYYRAADVFKNDSYRQIADETLDFILSDLATGTAAFAASLSAVDNRGIEGGYYLWTNDVLKKTLNSQEYDIINLYWGLSGAPDLEDGHHFAEVMSVAELASEFKIPENVLKKKLQTIREKLLSVRAKRVLPKDEKILTGWNALTLSAFISGAKHNDRYRQSAAKLVEFFKLRLWDSSSKELLRAYSETANLGSGSLEDYAYTAQALLAWWQLEKRSEDQQWLEEILTQAWRRFYGPQGWRLAENMLLKYGSGQTIVSDGPLPSPSSVLVATTYQYSKLTKNTKWRDKSLRALNVGHQDMREQVFYFATQLNALQEIDNVD